MDFERWKIREYGKELKPEILGGYKKEDDYMEFHIDDPDLPPIRIYLPVSPDWRKIDGFGLPAKDQYFKRCKVPPRLLNLEKTVANDKIQRTGKSDYVTLAEMWQYLVDNQNEYKEEISFIQKAWYHREYGYWCFINGKPTYMDGDHWLYCNNWNLDIGLPDYRDRDRRFFLVNRFFRETTESPFRFKGSWLDEEDYKEKYFGTEKEAEEWKVMIEALAQEAGREITNWHLETGEYIVDMGYRTVMGTNYPKHRREGATYKVGCSTTNAVTSLSDVQAGIMSMDEQHARKAFRVNFMNPFKKLWWFFKPEYEGTDDSKNFLSLKAAARIIGSKGAAASSRGGLNSFLDFSTTAKSDYYDSRKLIILYEDECGKTTGRDVRAGHDQTKHCIAQGNGAVIDGYTFKTSTVGEMTKKGGEGFYNLCKLSMYNDRNSTGKTQTGLITIFIPAYDGLEGFIGPYGESVIDQPTKEQAKFIGKDYGARIHLKIEEQQIRARKDKRMMEDLNEFLRLHPTRYRDCFRRATSSVGFNIAILTDRINALHFAPEETETGYFDFIERDQRVRWKRDREGPARISLLLPEGESNRFAKQADGKLYPLTERFIGSSDPTKFKNTEHNKMSEFGSAVFMLRDFHVDTQFKPENEWMTYRFVWDYVDRPLDEMEALRQALYASLYYGCKNSPEINVSKVWDFFENSKYGEFLYYFKNPDGTRKKTPGFHTGTGIKNDIFSAYRQYIEHHGSRERHVRILNQAAEIPGPEDMTDYDLFAAGGGCLITAENIAPTIVEGNEQSFVEEQKDTLINIEGFYDYI